jgi:hypothetical protein
VQRGGRAQAEFQVFLLIAAGGGGDVLSSTTGGLDFELSYELDLKQARGRGLRWVFRPELEGAAAAASESHGGDHPRASFPAAAARPWIAGVAAASLSRRTGGQKEVLRWRAASSMVAPSSVVGRGVPRETCGWHGPGFPRGEGLTAAPASRRAGGGLYGRSGLQRPWMEAVALLRGGARSPAASPRGHGRQWCAAPLRWATVAGEPGEAWRRRLPGYTAVVL